ncbi:MAG: hypothetical protein JWO51_1080 [Rhodospirillales bacterium]|nr:hypothetical protein [Rhodospirillales bacterium]
MTRVFDQVGLFAAISEAERFLSARKLSLGHIDRNEPRAIKLDAGDLPRWREMSPAQRDQLDGRVTGNMCRGPVVVEIYDRRPEAIAAFCRPDMVQAFAPTGGAL